MIEILAITISNPLLVGVYENKKLIVEHKLDGKTSDLLPSLFTKLLDEYDINTITYVNSPGSFMAIKVAYIFLKTICITKNIEFTCSNVCNSNKWYLVDAFQNKFRLRSIVKKNSYVCDKRIS